MLRARHHFKNFTCALNSHNSSLSYRDYCSHFADEEIESQVKQFPKLQNELNGKSQSLSPAPNHSLCPHLLNMWPAEHCSHKLFLEKPICVQIIGGNATSHMSAAVSAS